MRLAQNQKTTAWNAELLRLVVGATATALVAKLEGQLQLALESPRPRTFVQATQRFENFNEARTVLGESFAVGELLPEMRTLLINTVDAAFDRGRNFNFIPTVSTDGLGVSVQMTWSLT